MGQPAEVDARGEAGPQVVHAADARGLAGALREALGRFPRASLASLPTPLEQMKRLGLRAGHESLWVKRDDLTGLGFGGNKVRNLQYLLGDALCRNADVIVTSGGLQSNLCRLAAAASARLGLGCVLVHNDDRPEFWQGNMLLNHLAGAEQVFIGQVDETRRAVEVEVLAGRLAARGKRPYVIRNGGSTPLGALGFVEAAVELYEQSTRLGIGIRRVAMVGAMGGTAAGFVLGAALLGGPFHVHVISVEYDAGLLGRLVHSLAAGSLALLQGRGRLGAQLAGAEALARSMTIHGDYAGPGYALATPESLAALFDAARLEGLFVETVYTSKVLAGCLDLIGRGVIPAGEGCCFWHTGGTAALFAQAEALQPGRP